MADHERENMMEHAKKVANHEDECVVLMYPDNNLGDQVREYDDTFGVVEVIKETFFSESK